MSAANSGAFETLVSSYGPKAIAGFTHGSNVIRTALADCSAESTLTIAPLRGAMPVVWAVDGLSDFEGSSGAEFVEVPIGLHQRQFPDGIHEQSATYDQKVQIMSSYIVSAMAANNRSPSDTKLAIVDEVQMGGTISSASRAARGIIEKLGLDPELTVIAAHNSRRKSTAQPKAGPYVALASNRVSNTPTTVVPMPLVGTDRTQLLDSIHLEGDGRYPKNLDQRLVVTRNTDAERVFRTLGSLGRLPGLRHDGTFMHAFLNAQQLNSPELANIVESWMGRLVAEYDAMTNTSH
jgi:hypothetical protein